MNKRIWPSGLLISLILLCWTTSGAQETGSASDTDTAPPLASNAATVMAEEPESTTATNITTEPGSTQKVNREAIVVTGKDAELKAGQTAEVVVVIGGSARIYGKVRDTVTVIGGNAEIEGEVDHEVVAVMGNVKVGPKGKLHGDVVAAGGKVEIAEGGQVDHQPVEVDFGTLGIKKPEWLTKWLLNCALMLRPLSFSVGWIWAVAAGFFALYLLVALVFPRPVQACVEELTRRPATTFLMGLLTKLLLPLVLLILIVTVLGILVVPFVVAALLLGTIVGKVAVIEWFGFKLGRLFGGAAFFEKPVAAFLLGMLLITLLYLVPVLGLLTSLILSIWGLGAAVTAAFGGLRREMPERIAAPFPAYTEPTSTPASLAMPLTGAAATTAPGAKEVHEQSQPASASAGATATMVPPSMPVPEELAYPRAGFWERMGAGFLDIVLVGILSAIVGGMPLGLLVALAYFAGMWAWRGTTIGGIVLGLKVVRMDGQVLTFPAALVRGLAAGFSTIVLFLGFLWIAWDPDKQGWHDKIAGTIVLHLPRGTPLICL
jgi:uncharacterized RDD family membrane protein YckC